MSVCNTCIVSTIGIRLVPPSGEDTDVRRFHMPTVVKTRYHCFTALRQYRHLSLEELRLIDYKYKDGNMSSLNTPTMSSQTKPFISSLCSCSLTNTESISSDFGASTTSEGSKTSAFGVLNSSADSKPLPFGELNSSADSKPLAFGALKSSANSGPLAFGTLNTSTESKASNFFRTSTESKQLPFGTTTLSVESKASFCESSRKSLESKPFGFGSLATSTDDKPLFTVSMESKTTRVNTKPRSSIAVKSSLTACTKSKSLGSSSMLIPVSSFDTLSPTAESQPFGSLGSSTTSVFHDIVSISTGEGGLFTVPLAMLTKEKDSTLAAMFEGHSPLRKLPDGTFYIDVDKESFQEIMDFLRYNLHPQICRAGEKGFWERRILRLFKAAEKLGLYKLMSIIKQLEPVQHYLELNDKDIVDAVGLVLSRLDRRVLKRFGHFRIRLDCVRRCFDDLKNSCAHDCDINIFDAKIYLKDVESHTLEMICCSLKEKGFDIEGVEIFCDFVCKEHSQKPQNNPCCSRISYIVKFLCNDVVVVKRQPSSLFVLTNKKEGNHSSTEKQTERQCTTTSTQTEEKQPGLDRPKIQAVDVYEYSPGNHDFGVFQKNMEEPWA
ncbi:uncharacterized protein LOC128220286 isoform X2 [Mya arenaria]|uniref:uncharacterized protein LOC128220286 isoform X2 n=1 Tax=Mya arenaria TaxID=6604 RepID=UPI0022DFD319|nr:uncharacterized protein LOC128220286 isoform X2 [Mya arenaria]